MNSNNIKSISLYQKEKLLQSFQSEDLYSLTSGENALIYESSLPTKIKQLIKIDKNLPIYVVFDYEIDSNLIDSANNFFAMASSSKNISIQDLRREQINNMTVVELFQKVISLLESGELRAVSFSNGEYLVNEWVKKTLLLGFKIGVSRIDGNFCDKDTFPLRKISKEMQIRVVPPASGIRSGAYVGKGCVLMPPAYVNTGAYVGANTIIENLAGSCSQIGRHCHISAGAIIGGVLDPVEASPVIIGDYVLLGEGSGITQGVRLGHMVTVAPGVHISKATPVIDPHNNVAYTAKGTYSIRDIQAESTKSKLKIYELDSLIKESPGNHGPQVPQGALIIPGIMLSSTGILKQTPVIAKYINNPDERAYALEEVLRN